MAAYGTQLVVGRGSEREERDRESARWSQPVSAQRHLHLSEVRARVPSCRSGGTRYSLQITTYSIIMTADTTQRLTTVYTRTPISTSSSSLLLVP